MVATYSQLQGRNCLRDVLQLVNHPKHLPIAADLSTFSVSALNPTSTGILGTVDHSSTGRSPAEAAHGALGFHVNNTRGNHGVAAAAVDLPEELEEEAMDLDEYWNNLVMEGGNQSEA